MPGSVWNCLWGNALKRSPGINRKSRVSYPGPGFLSSATWPSLPKKHYNGSNNTGDKMKTTTTNKQKTYGQSNEGAELICAREICVNKTSMRMLQCKAFTCSALTLQDVFSTFDQT